MIKNYTLLFCSTESLRSRDKVAAKLILQKTNFIDLVMGIMCIPPGLLRLLWPQFFLRCVLKMRRHRQLFWGKKNAFIKYEVDAFVGVVSNVLRPLLGVYLNYYGAVDLTVSSGDSGAIQDDNSI